MAHSKTRHLQEQVTYLIQDLFNFTKVRYTSLNDLSEDIWMFCRSRIEALDLRLTGELPPPEGS